MMAAIHLGPRELIILSTTILISLLPPIILAVQARRRGYSLLVWVLAGALSNSILLLILLGVLPDYRRKRQRIQELADLEKRLLEASQRKAGWPSVDAGAPRVDRSLGDLPTILPPRSLGDEVTRG
jgi:hypothetical protein